MLPSSADWATFYAHFLRKTGIDLALYKANQLQRRIIGMAEQQGCADLAALWVWLGKGPQNLDWFLDKMAINVSELFRNPEKWADLDTRVIPDLLMRSKSLRVWSAGCSYGAEAHSLAMVLDAKYPGSHRIDGTDIDTAALTQAKEGRFVDSDVRCVPDAYKRAYLHRSGDHWVADDKLRKYLRFSRQNLLADRFDKGFDLIMCRNVVIYFTDEAKDNLYQRFFDALAPGGYLWVGSTERVFKAHDLGFETPLPFFYKKPLMGQKEWRTAS
ncbi:MAG: protein-glutamate O-methyltransferase CheR [Fimbriimonadaceae bacterium]|nr:protein-glutamate O-methyltransferase CheR [Fimbriimonadaceae bacterium]